MLDKKQKIVKDITSRIGRIATNYYLMGRDLHKLRELCSGSAEFKKYLSLIAIDMGIKLKYRKANYLIDAYLLVREYDLPDDMYTMLGWKKIGILYPYTTRRPKTFVYKTLEEAKDMTVVEIQKYINKGGKKDDLINLTIPLESETYKWVHEVLELYGMKGKGTIHSTFVDSFISMVKAAEEVALRK